MGNCIPSSDLSTYNTAATLVLDVLFIILIWGICGRIFGYSDPSAPTRFLKKDKEDIISNETESDPISEAESSQQLYKRAMSLDEGQNSIGSNDRSLSQDCLISDMTIRNMSPSNINSNHDDKNQMSKQRRPPPPKKKLSSSTKPSSYNSLDDDSSLINHHKNVNDLIALPRNQLPKYDDEEDESIPAFALAKALVVLSQGDEHNAWNTRFDAITTIRIILIHHRDRSDTHLSGALIAPAIAAAARTSIKPLSKNALHCISDSFFACQENHSLIPDLLTPAVLSLFCEELVEKFVSTTPNSIKDIAQQALEQLVHENSTIAVLIDVVPILTEKAKNNISSGIITEKTMYFVVQALDLATKVLDSSEEEFELSKDAWLYNEPFLSDLSDILTVRNVKTCKLARHCCKLFMDAFGMEIWTNAIARSDLCAEKMEELLVVEDDDESLPSIPQNISSISQSSSSTAPTRKPKPKPNKKPARSKVEVMEVEEL